MDPLSIAAGATGLVTACVKISAALYTFIDDTRHVDDNLVALNDEVLGLSRVLGAICKSWKQSPLTAIAQADPDGSLWSSVKASLDDCGRTLGRLEKNVNDIQQKDSFFGRLKVTRSIRFNLKAKDVMVFRQQIQTYNGAMQSSLQMINVCLLIYGQSSQDMVIRGLDGLKDQLGRLESEIGTMNALQVPDASGQEIQFNRKVTDTLRRLARAAETFHSSASTVAGGSTVWGGSVSGEPLHPDQYRSIEEWIPPPIEEESPVETVSETSRVTSPSANSSINYTLSKTMRATTPSTNVSTNVPTAPSTILPDEHPANESEDSELDVEAELAKKFEELALSNFRREDYSKAELFLRKLAARYKNDQESPAAIASIDLKIAFACCMQWRWDEAEAIAFPLTTGKSRIDIAPFHLLHAIALQRMNDGGDEGLGKAMKLCKRALGGKKKLLGKNSESFRQTTELLGRIYEAQGNHIEAEACRELYPAPAYADDSPARLDARNYLTENVDLQVKSLPPPENPKGPLLGDIQSSGGLSPQRVPLEGETSSPSALLPSRDEPRDTNEGATTLFDRERLASSTQSRSPFGRHPPAPRALSPPGPPSAQLSRTR
ncbi:hypothetical protein P152DRAFT_120686 [Eremomyces bilateralis CBS 781.70]|uniref:Azaphilone pigments biosynthesis cluster protein L N-terminal domain-containing protein n=1 Tax=Eremomyces bilateralis CBS 781.70 TaxID=1392243 RepID=A0A6G1GEA9_9PEZI|nr:uncharacterized protein P152DRAFT_120686 [Eremomyces bilateralis CBS 781.70]KAF1816362.1 hypothetical protein P152DRAFT_120686 [Eremomyces bilateralis CBS 781.70]